jgi:hypothetical protein
MRSSSPRSRSTEHWSGTLLAADTGSSGTTSTRTAGTIWRDIRAASSAAAVLE